jgi:hypothetical protein
MNGEDAKKTIQAGNLAKLQSIFHTTQQPHKTLRKAPSTIALQHCPHCSKIQKLHPFTHPFTGKISTICSGCAKHFNDAMQNSDLELARATQAAIDRQAAKETETVNSDLELARDTQGTIDRQAANETERRNSQNRNLESVDSSQTDQSCIECGSSPASSIEGIYFCQSHMQEQLRFNFH